MNRKNLRICEIHDFNHANMIEKLHNYFPNILFEDDIWFYPNPYRTKATNKNKSYFTNVPNVYKKIAKYYSIELLEYVKPSTITGRVTGIAFFFRYLEEYHNSIKLHNFNRNLFKKYECFLRDNNTLSRATKENYFTAFNEFFRLLSNHSEMPKEILCCEGNPLSRKKTDRKVEGKLIPMVVLNQLDSIMKKKVIPLHIRLTYWILRSFPNRINEVANIKFDCLKPSHYDGEYALFIPTEKQNGGYFQPETKVIYIKNDGHGKFLIDLINTHKQELIKENLAKHNILLFYTIKKFDSNLYKKNGAIRYISGKNGRTSTSISGPTFIRQMNKICKVYNVIDDNSNLFHFTSHMLRHNAIHDRSYAGFSLTEIRDMSGHKGEEMMCTAYIHPNEETNLNIQKKISPEEFTKPVYFKGKILNMSESQEKRLLANPRAFEIRHLGICSDMSNCNSDFFECLSCDYLVPDVEDYNYFSDQLDVWKFKHKKFASFPMIQENCMAHIENLVTIIARLDKVIEEGKNE
jgi:integrase